MFSTSSSLILIEKVLSAKVTIEVYINAGEQQVPNDLPKQEIIFAHKYRNQQILDGGALIVRRNV